MFLKGTPERSQRSLSLYPSHSYKKLRRRPGQLLLICNLPPPLLGEKHKRENYNSHEAKGVKMVRKLRHLTPDRRGVVVRFESLRTAFA